ncbi:MAG: GSCFA domain-containing protein [Crocinitomicaceae bacterium]|nr:GSCFA domain-containing protein [Crocinitomicaceae bacterium]
MKTTSVTFPNYSIEINRTVPVAFLGSCFSEHLSRKLNENKFSVVSNPLGVIFNPMSLAYILELESEKLIANNFERNNVWLNWSANATIFGYSNEALEKVIRDNLALFQDRLSASNVLFVTFGSAWVYEHLSNSAIVANCHKQPSRDFNKRLLSSDEIVGQWTKTIRQLNKNYPALNIVFTVSPVRHIKDGVVDNTRSKSILLEAVHQLTEKFSQVEYFPVYEFFMDELRDYAYYKKDGIHPNEIAIDLVWEKFEHAFFGNETKAWLHEFQRLTQQLEHRPLHPDSVEAKEFVAKAQREMETFLAG